MSDGASRDGENQPMIFYPAITFYTLVHDFSQASVPNCISVILYFKQTSSSVEPCIHQQSTRKAYKPVQNLLGNTFTITDALIFLYPGSVKPTYCKRARLLPYADINQAN